MNMAKFLIMVYLLSGYTSTNQSVKIKKLSKNIPKINHSWNLNQQEAAELQQKLARQVKLTHRIEFRNVKTVGESIRIIIMVWQQRPLCACA